MGLFTNKCSDCGYRVRKGSKFCPGCGAGAPKGVVVCGSCSKEVRSSAKFCWNCGAEQATVAPPKFTSNRWARLPEDFATRIDETDVHGWLVKPLIIEHGTRALFFQGGRFVGELAAGTFDVGGFAARIKHFLNDQPASIVLLDAGDVTIDLENEGLWTADQVEVGTRLRLVLQAAEPEAMFVNLIKGRGRVPVDELERELGGEVQMLLRGILGRFRAERLFASFDVRYEVEAGLREHLTATLARLGLTLVQLRFIDFAGPAYEQLRQKRAQVGETEQRLQLAQRLREVLTTARLHAFKSEKDFGDFVRQTEHELGLKGVIRADEMQRLQQRFQFERDREQLLRRIEIEAIVSDHQREEAWKHLVADERARDERHQRELERALLTTKGEAERRGIDREKERLEHLEQLRQREAEHLQDLAEARHGTELLRGVKEVEQWEADQEQQREARRLAVFSQADAKALMAILDGPAADRLAELERFRAQQSLSPEQLLGIAAAASPDAARALATKYQAEGQLSRELVQRLEQQLAEQRQLTDAYAERMERIMQTALHQMGSVAATRAQPVPPQQTVVVPGGIGGPVVVAPAGTQPAVACRHCAAALERGGGFCPHCGKPQ
jgi:hypothetical protein